MPELDEKEKLEDDFDLTLDSFGAFNELLDDKKDEEIIITDFTDYIVYNTSKSVYKTFNKKYEEYLSLQDKLTPSKEERERIVVLGEEMAILIAIEFNFEDKELEGMKEEYVEFARERLVEGTKKPYFRHMSMLYYIRALYGQTNIAFSLEGDNRKTNILLGNDYVTRLERYTDVRALKAYVLALRAYRFIIDGDIIDMELDMRLKTVEKDLVYATKWDTDNYLAQYALALVYLNKNYENYSLEKATNLFKEVLDTKGRKVPLDEYVSEEEKNRIITLAEKKLELLK